MSNLYILLILNFFNYSIIYYSIFIILFYKEELGNVKIQKVLKYFEQVE